MSAQFRQVLDNAGVDELLAPIMIVPRGGSNVVGLADGKNLHLVPEPKAINIIRINEIDPVMYVLSTIPPSASWIPGASVAKWLLEGMVRRAALPPGMRAFQISSNLSLGETGALVHAMERGTSKPKATLRVVVLGKRGVKLAIRPLMVRDAQDRNKWVRHSQKPPDTEYLCSTMNAVWEPQSNVVFDLVSSEPAYFDDEAGYAKALGSKADKVPLSSMFNFDVVAPLLKKLRHPNADLTMFLVERIGNRYYFTDGSGTRHGPQDNNGQTGTEDAIAVIADKGRDLGDGERVMAHEAGHWLGSFRGRGGQWVDYGHPESDKNMLMSDGGGGVKITAAATLGYFNKNY